jgi:hypothetical protein
MTGPSLTPISSSYDPANLNLACRGSTLRLDCIADGNLSNPTPDQYFNLSAFQAVPAAGKLGNCGLGPGTVALGGTVEGASASRKRADAIRGDIYESAEPSDLRAATSFHNSKVCVFTLPPYRDAGSSGIVKLVQHVKLSTNQ